MPGAFTSHSPASPWLNINRRKAPNYSSPNVRYRTTRRSTATTRQAYTRMIGAKIPGMLYAFPVLPSHDILSHFTGEIKFCLTFRNLQIPDSLYFLFHSPWLGFCAQTTSLHVGQNARNVNGVLLFCDCCCFKNHLRPQTMPGHKRGVGLYFGEVTQARTKDEQRIQRLGAQEDFPFPLPASARDASP